ncbi:MAG: amidohydrolase family protein, partial [Thermoplasmata archaeon]|nr:amidohydrolase family protein [Thermoplasmata archaeon]
SRRARSAGKRFALHVSESAREDIDEVLSLRPDFVVHMTKATEEDVRACADRGVPIVVCPRSNEFYGSRPDIPMMHFSGAVLALGTDNCMISRPDMFEEMKAAFRICAENGAMEPSEVVKLATVGGRKVLKAKRNILTEYGEKGDLVVVRSGSRDPALELINATGSDMIDMVVRGGKVRRSKTCRR